MQQRFRMVFLWIVAEVVRAEGLTTYQLGPKA
jgi:hypothetical protein